METNSIIEILELIETHLINGLTNIDETNSSPHCDELRRALGKTQFLMRELKREVDFLGLIESKGGK